jgi:hypothetical protein
MNKLILPLTLLCIPLTVLAQSSPPVPEKLTALKTSYEGAIARATSPITKTYVVELQKLRTQFTKKGDLQAALAVDNELKMLSPSGDPKETEKLSATAQKKLLREFMMARKWSYGPTTLTFKANDTADSTDGSVWQYQLNPGIIIINGKEFPVDMNSNTIPLPKFGPDGGDRAFIRQSE